jgi:thiol-disulfide isomerase/thioredoxin
VWYQKFGTKALKIGDKVPDIPLGMVVNNYTGKNSLSQFKGRLVILDFWSTGCTTCMEKFPEMENLQKEFKDQIQILLVNPWQTKEAAKEHMPSWAKLPNLPIIFASTDQIKKENQNPFLKLFPARTIPLHVWIDANGIIRLRGSHQNTYAEKIKAFLAGQKVFVLNSESTVPSLNTDVKAKYYQQLGELKATPVVYGSFITPYNNELDGNFQEVIDSSAKTRIIHFINTDLIDIYGYALTPSLTDYKKEVLDRLLYSPMNNPRKDLLDLPKNADTLNYTTLFSSGLIDEQWIRGKYCYEQVSPLELSEEKRKSYMVEDLNRYFELHYGTRGIMEKKPIHCYILVRTSSIDKLSPTNAGHPSINLINENGKHLRKFESFDLVGVMNYTIRNSKALAQFFVSNKASGSPFLLLNETDWDIRKPVDMVFPVEGLNTIEDLRQALKPYDLDIIEADRAIDFLIIENGA